MSVILKIMLTVMVMVFGNATAAFDPAPRGHVCHAQVTGDRDSDGRPFVAIWVANNPQAFSVSVSTEVARSVEHWKGKGGRTPYSCPEDLPAADYYLKAEEQIKKNYSK